MIRIFALIALVSLSGCVAGPAAQTVATDVARTQAKGVINGVVQARFPGVNAAPITDCIIDNASLTEIFQIAKATVTGVTPETTDLVIGISKRPATLDCMINNSLKGFL